MIYGNGKKTYFGQYESVNFWKRYERQSDHWGFTYTVARFARGLIRLRAAQLDTFLVSFHVSSISIIKASRTILWHAGMH